MNSISFSKTSFVRAASREGSRVMIFTFSLQFFAVPYRFSFAHLLDCGAFVNYLDNPTDSKEILNEKVALRSWHDERACNRSGRACCRACELRRHLDA